MRELRDRFDGWGKEYQQPRDLGIRGEFVGLYRKTRKLKTLFWDHPEVPEGWREDPRTIMLEVAAHALLMLCDWDGIAVDPDDANEGDSLEAALAAEEEEPTTAQGVRALQIMGCDREEAERRARHLTAASNG